MKTTNFPIFTTKSDPSDAEIISHKLMIRSGMIRKLSSGQYTWLPLGLKVIDKIQNVVRSELNKIGCREILMPLVQPNELWKESGRWSEYGPELLRFKDRHEREFCFGPTFEEVITDLLRQDLSSYKQLPINFFQISTKFRDEIRPRFGVMRSREFIMKDAYSFHATKTCLDTTYVKYMEAYKNIFNSLMLKFTMVDADSGNIGGSESHEFHVIADTGEDDLLLDDTFNGMNVEIAKQRYQEESLEKIASKSGMKLKKGIEVGHIFKLGTKYSKPMNLTFTDENSKINDVFMGCYGIGISRVVAAAIEQNYDDKGIIWPKRMAPFQVAIIELDSKKACGIREYAENIYDALEKNGIDVIYDNRSLKLGNKLADWELIGIPNILIIGQKETENTTMTLKRRDENQKHEVTPEFVNNSELKI